MLNAPHDRASFIRTAGAIAIGAVPLARLSAALAADAPAVTPAAAIARLMAGNARFVTGRTTGGSGIGERRRAVAPGQAPFAAVLTCADSRVAPEYVFDQRLGDVFVCRVAGNVLDADILGSLEYAVEHFHSSAIVVLGHQRCGAVTDAVELHEHHKKAPGDVQHIVDAIEPAIRATARGALSQDAYVDAVIRANARLVAGQVASRSPALHHAVRAGRLRIVAARYSLDTGRVALLP